MRNLLLVTTDQMRGDHMGCVGHPALKTPHLDRLAAAATLFTNHFAGAAPCGPARACLYTGLYQMNNRVCRNGTPLDARLDTIALAFRRNGFHPVLFGYTDTAPDPRTLPFDDPRLRDYQGTLPGFDVELELKDDNAAWFEWLTERGHVLPDPPADIYLPGDGAPGPPNTSPPAYLASETETAFVTEKFIDWLNYSADSDWFAHVSYARPHPPFVVPAPFNTMYRPRDMIDVIAPSSTNPGAFHPLVAYLRDRARKDDFVHGATGLARDWTRSDLAALRATYCGMISEVDAQIGRLLDALKQTGAWEETLIVFTSDHGEYLGDHGLMGKGGFHDPAYHVPLIIRDPTRISGHGHRVGNFTEACDVMPTALEAFDITPLQPLDGRPLTGFLSGATPPDWRSEVHWEFDFREIASREAQLIFGLQAEDCRLAVLRDNEFKYVHCNGLPPLLFDLTKDPKEKANVAGVQSYSGEHIRYAEKMLTWRARHQERTLTGIELTKHGPIGFEPSLT